MTSLDHYNKLCLVTLHFPPSTSCHCLDHVPARELDKKFDEIVNPKNTLNNNPTNILNNLCTGLEKFLGFDPSSKGYDGSGIVYSDLDRLCDGVMGFLSGVLGAVKDDEAVKTYDEYMRDDDKLDKVLKELNTKIGSGRTGLVESVTEVKGWLEGYGKKLRDMAKVVVGTESSREGTLMKLETQIDENINEIVKFKHFDRDVPHWQAAVTADLSNKVREVNAAIQALDFSLQKKLMDHFAEIEGRINDFKKNAGSNQEEMLKLSDTVQDKMIDLQKKVIKEATEVGEECIKELKSGFENKIKVPISQVQVGLHVVGGKVEEWCKHAHAVVTAALKNCEDVLGKLRNGDQEYKQIMGAAQRLKAKADTLMRAIIAAKGTLTATVEEAHRAVSTINDAIKTDLNNLKINISNVVSEYVRSEILQKIAIKVTNIRGVPKGNEGLEGVKMKVKRYAEKFKNDFPGVVKEWINDILKRNESVKQSIGNYLHVCRTMLGGVSFHSNYVRMGGYEFIEDTTEEIANTIKASMVQGGIDMTNADVGGSHTDEDKVAANIKAVYTRISTFRDQLRRQIQGGRSNAGDSNTFVRKIAEDLEKMIVDGDATGTSHLEYAVSSIFAALIAKANQAAKVIDAFAGAEHDADSKIGDNVDKALDETAQLEDDLKLGVGQVDAGTGSGIFKGKVDALIAAEVEKELPAEIVLGGSNKVNVDAVVRFDTYHGGNGKAGKRKELKDAIAAVESNVQAELDSIHDPSDPSKKQPIEQQSLTDALKAFTDALSKFANAITRIVKSNGVNWSLEDYLKKLRNMLGKCGKKYYGLDKGLEEIREDIVKILGIHSDPMSNYTHNLTTIMYEAEHFHITSIQQKTSNCIRLIAEKVQHEVSFNIAAIKHDTLERYVTTTINDMSRLKAYLAERREKMSKTINDDLTRGVKGLFMVMSGVPAMSQHSQADNGNKLDALNNGFILTAKDSANLNMLSDRLKNYLDAIVTYIWNDIGKIFDSQLSIKYTYQSNMNSIKDALDLLLKHLTYQNTYLFDRSYVKLLAKFKSTLSKLQPDQFGATSCPNLDVLKCGLRAFTTELSKAYVSVYDGTNPISQWVDEKRKLTTEGKHGAKVFLTLLETLNEDLPNLKKKCENNSRNSTISLSSDLGGYFKRLGYGVAKNGSSQDGELRRSEEMKGSNVLAKIESAIQTANHIKHLTTCESNKNEQQNGPKKSTNFNVLDLLACLHRHLEDYYSVSHYATFTAKRTPCSVYEMLAWCAGLPYTNVYSEMRDITLSDMFEDPNKKTADDSDIIPLTVMSTVPIQAHPNNIIHGRVASAIGHICSQSYDVLCTILGTGNEYTLYASDFCTNALRLKYPGTGEECLDMLVDILRRLFLPLRFLEGQCGHPASSHGWSDCLYGKDVPTTKSHCDIKSTDKATSQGKCQPTCRPKSQPNCQPTSPLMSYLHDSLPGWLPHNLTAIGCKYDCSSCSKSTPGMPCLTPLGFRGFSGSTRKGEEIYDVIDKFFSNIYVSSLFALQAKAPASLPEHFGFTLSLVSGWDNSDIAPVKRDLENSIRDVSIELYDDASKLTTALSNAYGSNQNHHHKQHHDSKHADLSNLSMSSICSDKNHCAPYLASLCSDQYQYAPVKLSKQYLSWVTYLPWDFWKYLNDLYKAFCAISCQDWGCRTCLRGDKCNGSGHGMLNPKQPGEGCQCSSVVSCKGVSPTLYKYGFRFAIPWKLHDKGSRKTCFEFRSQLNSVLQSQYFKDLFEKCDEFLWIIRQPFSYLVLALWLLSFLYLIHIMVIRLDLLHIKSHLHSPSSHRISAQSLLAAGRVNKLNRVFYLQP